MLHHELEVQYQDQAAVLVEVMDLQELAKVSVVHRNHTRLLR